MPGASGHWERNHSLRCQQLVGERQHRVGASALAERVRDGSDDGPPVEGRSSFGQSIRPGQPVEQALHPRSIEFDLCLGDGATRPTGHGRVGNTEVGGLLAPFGEQVGRRGVTVLRATGAVRRHLRRPGRGLTSVGELSLDLGPPLREGADDVAGDCGDVGDAVAHRSPLDAEASGQLRPECRLVEMADGLRPREELAAIE